MASQLARHFLLRDDVTFLNHGSYGACPKPVFETYQAFQRELESQPVAFFEPHKMGRRFRAVRERVAPLLGTDADHFVWQTNATTGLNVAVQSLSLSPGDEILTTTHEYAALEKLWAFVTRRNGAKIVRVEVPLPLTSAEQFIETLTDAMNERTRVLFLSHITSPTALVFPIEDVVAEARKRGILTVIDGAHVPGNIPLSIDALQPDIYAGNFHKWVLSPKGSAFLYVRPGLQHQIDPLVISHGWLPEGRDEGATGPFGNPGYVDQLDVQGTRDPAAWLSVPSALDFLDEHNWASVAEACAALARETAERINALTGLQALSHPDFSAPHMIAMQLPDCDTAALKVTLLDEYSIEIPVHKWHGLSLIRLSVQGYNDRADMDRLVGALQEIFAL